MTWWWKQAGVDKSWWSKLKEYNIVKISKLFFHNDHQHSQTIPRYERILRGDAPPTLDEWLQWGWGCLLCLESNQQTGYSGLLAPLDNIDWFSVCPNILCLHFWYHGKLFQPSQVWLRRGPTKVHHSELQAEAETHLNLFGFSDMFLVLIGVGIFWYFLFKAFNKTSKVKCQTMTPCCSPGSLATWRTETPRRLLDTSTHILVASHANRFLMIFGNIVYWTIWLNSYCFGQLHSGSIPSP